MPVYEFEQEDILYSSLVSHPHYEFLLYSGSIYLNNRKSSAKNIPDGYVSLNELNVDRDPALHTWEPDTGTGAKNLIYPFITKDGTGDGLATVSTTNFRFGGYGDEMTGSYPLSASLHRYYLATGSAGVPHKKYIKALRNSIDYYKRLSPRYDYDGLDYGNRVLGLVSIPSIFYGSSIEKGTVKLKFFVTGTLEAELHDKYRNGELVQVSGSTTGSVEGLVLYNEGFILLTGTDSVKDTADNYNTCEVSGGAGTQNSFCWALWGEMGAAASGSTFGNSSCEDDAASHIQQTSYGIEFNGTTITPNITMFAHAPKGELNHSNNTTFLEHNSNQMDLTGSDEYRENKYLKVKNTVSSSYANHNAPFEKQTFLSTIKIYDENHECIAIAKLARPIKKTEERGYTFKLKLDV